MIGKIKQLWDAVVPPGCAVVVLFIFFCGCDSRNGNDADREGAVEADKRIAERVAAQQKKTAGDLARQTARGH